VKGTGLCENCYGARLSYLYANDPQARAWFRGWAAKLRQLIRAD